MTEIPSCILSQYLWYNANIQVDKKILVRFHNFLVTMATLKNGISLRESTIYIRIIIFSEYN